MSEENQEQSATPNSASQAKTETIATLRQTVRQLERLILALEAQSDDTLPAIAALDNLTSSLEEVSAAVETATGAPLPELPAETPARPSPTTPLEEPVELGWLDRVLPSFDRLQAGWDWVLARARGFLPASLSEKLSDWAITSILAGIVVIFLLAAVLVSPGPPPSSAIARVSPNPRPLEVPAVEPVEPSLPDVPAAAPEPPSTPSDLPESLELEPEAEEPLPPPDSEAPVEPEEPAEVEIVAPAEIEAPQELEAPAEPEVVAVEEPPPTPLTPEQTLIASIQNRVAEITSQYADGLIRSIQADFLGSQLTVTLEERWYDLAPDRQDRVADDVRARSQELDFSKLKMLDLNGNVLARTAVVGDGMVVVRRTRE